MIYVELPKFIKKNPDANNSLYQWLWLLAGREDKVKMAKKELKEAMGVIDEMSAAPKEWEMYESKRNRKIKKQ